MQFLFQGACKGSCPFSRFNVSPCLLHSFPGQKEMEQILYLGATFALTLVEDTPGLTEDVRMLIFPTKSSEEKVQCVFGLKNFAFSTKC